MSEEFNESEDKMQANNFLYDTSRSPSVKKLKHQFS